MSIEICPVCLADYRDCDERMGWGKQVCSCDTEDLPSFYRHGEVYSQNPEKALVVWGESEIRKELDRYLQGREIVRNGAVVDYSWGNKCRIPIYGLKGKFAQRHYAAYEDSGLLKKLQPELLELYAELSNLEADARLELSSHGRLLIEQRLEEVRNRIRAIETALPADVCHV